MPEVAVVAVQHRVGRLCVGNVALYLRRVGSNNLPAQPQRQTSFHVSVEPIWQDYFVVGWVTGRGREVNTNQSMILVERRLNVNRRSNLTPHRRPILTPLGDGFWR